MIWNGFFIVRFLSGISRQLYSGEEVNLQILKLKEINPDLLSRYVKEEELIKHILDGRLKSGIVKMIKNEE